MPGPACGRQPPALLPIWDWRSHSPRRGSASCHPAPGTRVVLKAPIIEPDGQAVAPTHTQGPAGDGQVEIRAECEVGRKVGDRRHPHPPRARCWASVQGRQGFRPGSTGPFTSCHLASKRVPAGAQLQAGRVVWLQPSPLSCGHLPCPCSCAVPTGHGGKARSKSSWCERPS